MKDVSKVKFMDILYNILLNEDLLDLKRIYLAEYSTLNHLKKESNHIDIEKDFFSNNELKELTNIISLKSTKFFETKDCIVYEIPSSMTSKQMAKLFKNVKKDIRNKKISSTTDCSTRINAVGSKVKTLKPRFLI